MSEQNKPQSGEWWLNDNGERVRIVGWSSNGRLYFEYECGTVLNRKPANTNDWKHLQNCTGWDWQPEPEPEWFDLTPFDGHVLRKRADWCRYGIHEDFWQPVADSAGRTIAETNSYIAEVRCLLKDTPPELVAKAKEAESVYGFCPVCGAPGVTRERRLNGNDRCFNGHEYPSKDALPQKPKAETVAFYEFAVKCGHGNKNLQLKWRDAKPASNDWIPTGRTETREVVR